ncbi:erythromycin esterase [Prauserella coralliicola]|nr:erythromycin esterase [Prauserella coralliicola]
MTQDIRDFVTASTGLLAFGEPTHLEPAFGRIRNELFARLTDHGFSSIALETDRVAALAVHEFVHNGVGTLEQAMRDGFSHRFGELETNRRLVAWMREYNENRPEHERLAFHGFDMSTEMMSAPSPRTYLEHVRDYLALDLDLASLTGDDERWSRTEAVLDPAVSVGATAEADRLRVLADDLLTTLHARAPELIAATSPAEWHRARIHLGSALGLLCYHRQAAERVDDTTRWTRLAVIRDAQMARNLLDIREIEAPRGRTLVFAHNLHLQRNPSHLMLGPMPLQWFSAGAIVASLLGEQYTFVAGSLGRSDALALSEPGPDTYEAFLQRLTSSWALVPATAVTGTRPRTDQTPEQGYFPLEQPVLDTADAVLHVSGTAKVPAPGGRS